MKPTPKYNQGQLIQHLKDLGFTGNMPNGYVDATGDHRFYVYESAMLYEYKMGRCLSSTIDNYKYKELSDLTVWVDRCIADSVKYCS